MEAADADAGPMVELSAPTSKTNGGEDRQNGESWPGEWLRGLLGVCVLAVIARGPTYGYRIVTDLTKAGIGDVKGGTLYPLLARAERDGLVATRWEAGDGGPGRKFYELTANGRRQLADSARQWKDFTATIDAIVETDTGGKRQEES